MKKLLVVITLFLFIGMSILPSTIGILKEKTVLMNLGTRGYIQDLIDNASDGDTIYVPSGIYYECIVINKSISLIGEDKNTTIIDGGGGWRVVYIVSDWVNISGFTIRYSDYLVGTGICIDSCYNNITTNILTYDCIGIVLLEGSNYNIIINNIIKNNIDGVFQYNESSMNIFAVNTISNNSIGMGLYGDNNAIFSNTITNNWVGINLYESSGNNNITGNNINSNNGHGIRLGYSSGNNITSNTVTNNNYSIYLEYSSDNIITSNIIMNNSYGIYLEYSSGNNIINNNISLNNGNGISLFPHWEWMTCYPSNNNIIIGNNISNNNGNGIHLLDSSGNNIIGNTMVNDGISIQGYGLEHWSTHVIDTSNTVNGNPVIYWKNQIGGAIPSGAGQVILANCTNVVVENQEINNGGIELGFSSNCAIMDNNITNNEIGIHLYGSSGNNITENNINSNNEYGIYLTYYSGNNNITNNNISLNNGNGIYIQDYTSGNNIITGNNITNNEIGIYLYGSSGNNITENNINSNNEYGIYLYYSSSNIITGNNFIWNKEYGIFLSGNSNNNSIYHNNFEDNQENAYDECDNTWDDGKKGNYWSDYEEKYPDAKKKPFKGVWDTPYEIDGGDNKDNFPLIKPFNKPRNRTVNIPFQNLLEHYKILFLILQLILSRLGQ